MIHTTAPTIHSVAFIHHSTPNKYNFTTTQDVDIANEIATTFTEALDRSVEETFANLTNMGEFSEAAITHQLRKRYGVDDIYTGVGDILVSVNPYKLLPNIYGSAVQRSYEQANADDASALPPHVFKIADTAFRNVFTDYNPQAVLISGESGAGKTEATKLVLQYLSSVAASESRVEQRVLESNPILEAFGNAKTCRNDNSSRFGKWMRVYFDNTARIRGCGIVNYLLEKSRVCGQGPNERNYHAFYLLLAGVSEKRRHALGLTTQAEYHYLNQNACYPESTVDSQRDFHELEATMRHLGFTDDDVDNVWGVLALVLHLGNIQPVADASNSAASDVADAAQVGLCARMLCVDDADLKTAIVSRSIVIRGETQVIHLTAQQAVSARDSLAKAIYVQLFDWIVLRVNQTLDDGSSNQMLSVGVLDIFGFEVFDDNLFEQFCINYANEKLQAHFTAHIFKQEQAEYAAEGLDIQVSCASECLADALFVVVTLLLNTSHAESFFMQLLQHSL
jgi:myosin heavy subunit